MGLFSKLFGTKTTFQIRDRDLLKLVPELEKISEIKNKFNIQLAAEIKKLNDTASGYRSTSIKNKRREIENKRSDRLAQEFYRLLNIANVNLKGYNYEVYEHAVRHAKKHIKIKVGDDESSKKMFMDLEAIQKERDKIWLKWEASKKSPYAVNKTTKLLTKTSNDAIAIVQAAFDWYSEKSGKYKEIKRSPSNINTADVINLFPSKRRREREQKAEKSWNERRAA